MADIRFLVTVDSATATAAIKQIDGDLQNLGKTAGGTTDKGNELGRAFSGIWQQFTIGAVAANVVTGAISGIKNFFDTAIKGAIDEEASAHRLATALELTGRARGGAVKDMLDFAREQSHVTTYSHEEIEATETLLAQMTKLDNEGIKQATKGVIGLAAVLGPEEGGLNGATRMVVRAMEGQLTGLHRVGISVDENLPKHEQLRQAMEKLAALYPRANAELETMSGQLKMLSKSWDEVKENVGGFLIEALDVKDMLPGTSKLLLDMAEALEKIRNSIGGQSGAVEETTKKWLNPAESLGGFSGVVEKLTGYMTRQSQYTKDYADVAKQLWDSYNEIGESATMAAVAQGKFGDEAKKAFSAISGGAAGINNAFKAPIDATALLEQNFKDLGVTSEKELRAKLELAIQTLAGYQAQGGRVTSVIEGMKKKIGELEDALTTLPSTSKTLEPLQLFWDVTGEKMQKVGDNCRGLGDIIGGTLGGLVGNFDDMKNAEGGVEIETTKLRAAWEAVDRFQALNRLRELTAQLDEMKKSGRYSREELEKLAAEIKKVQEQAGKTTAVDKFITAMDTIKAAADQCFGAIDAAFQQSQKNKEIALDNEYQKRLAIIKATIKDETAQRQAIEALDAEYDLKRRSLEANAAKEQKAIALGETIVNTAAGVARALKDYPWPLSIIVGAIVAAAGAVQAKLIASQPVGLAEGTVFTRRTVLYTPAGREVQMGEGGEPEVLSPVSKIRQAVREEIAAMRAAFPSRQLLAGGRELHVHIESPLIVANGLDEQHVRQAGNLLWKVIEDEARRHPFGGRG
jgi:flagellar biosynthesis chaperone FliJ